MTFDRERARNILHLYMQQWIDDDEALDDLENLIEGDK